MRRARVRVGGDTAGWLSEDESGYHFVYDSSYAQRSDVRPVSLTLPVRQAPYHAERELFAFFDGLIPDGWLLDIAEKNWKLDQCDRMGLLLACCRDCIGAVSIEEVREDEPQADAYHAMAPSAKVSVTIIHHVREHVLFSASTGAAIFRG